MELKELTDKTLDIFGVDDIYGLTEKIAETVESDDFATYKKFEELVTDLSVDWLQKIYQYYLADRKEKMQDYTPKTLALLMARIALRNNGGVVVDMCAGSGALTIQAWNLNHELEFECLEFDENVLPILLFNLAVRNAKATIKHMDVLQEEVIAVYRIEQTEKYGKVVKL